MLLAAVVSLSLIGHLPSPPWSHHGRSLADTRETKRRYQLGPWRLDVRRDPFAATTTCQVRTREISVERDILIFRVAPQGDTTAAVFRVDSGPPRRVSEAFDTVEAKGFFPQRGWIVDPNGGEAALPTSYVTGAQAVTMRVSPGRRPHRFAVGRLAEVEASARGLGCSI